MLLSDVCRLSCVYLTFVAYVGNNSRTERPRKTKISTEAAHVTRDSDNTTFKVKRSRSPGRFTHHSFNAWGRCSGDRENVLGVGNYYYVASARRRARSWGAHEGRRGAGHIVSTRAQACFCLAKVHSVWWGGMIASTFFASWNVEINFKTDTFWSSINKTGKETAVNIKISRQTVSLGCWTFRIKNSSKRNQLFLHCWRFGFYQVVFWLTFNMKSSPTKCIRLLISSALVNKYLPSNTSTGGRQLGKATRMSNRQTPGCRTNWV